MLSSITAEMQRSGIRRLAVIAGDADWCWQQAQQWRATLAGDWPLVSERDDLPNVTAPSALRNLLGQEFRHAIFDARSGFHSEAFAALAGTLSAGSWLLLLTPAWESWAAQPDRDTLRWSESDTPIAAPHFIQHLQRQLAADTQVWLQRQHQPCRQPTPLTLSDWRPAGMQQQQALLTRLLQARPGVFILTAARGRGKSALAGMLVQRWPGACLITAPARVSTEVLARFAGDRYRFIAPDALLNAAPPPADWLIIDEAAAIPAPLLQRLIERFPRVLLTTTVQGYEGTGRGFLLKFCASLSQAAFYQLDEPLRWRQGDPLEGWVNRALMLDETYSVADDAADAELSVTLCGRDDPPRLLALYQLLTSAHYRTTPLDLRRLLDAPGQRFIAAENRRGEMAGALWLVAEGGLSVALSWAVWAGRRRPRGSLVAQSLAAHAGFPQAAQLVSWRVSRIAVAPGLRRQQIGSRLLAAARAQAEAEGLDYLSVSFGFTAELWRFWQRCGFTLARIATQREASSGCYSAMAILPLSAAGRQLSLQAEQRLARDLYWLQPLLEETIPLAPDDNQQLDEEDWRALAGFAFAHRAFDVSLPALARLLLATPSAGLTLHEAVIAQHSPAAICRRAGLSGRKALLERWRAEARQLMQQLDAAGYPQWKQAVAELS